MKGDKRKDKRDGAKGLASLLTLRAKLDALPEDVRASVRELLGELIAARVMLLEQWLATPPAQRRREAPAIARAWVRAAVPLRALYPGLLKCFPMPAALDAMAHHLALGLDPEALAAAVIDLDHLVADPRVLQRLARRAAEEAR